MEKKTKLEERWREGYEEGWDNGFRACLMYLKEVLCDQIVEAKRKQEKRVDNQFRRKL